MIKTREGLRKGVLLSILLGTFILLSPSIFATTGIPNIDIRIGSEGDGQLSESLWMLVILTILSVAPSILIMMTSFTRIIISLYFVKSALGTQQMPPSQVMVGLALFMTFFVMNPVFTQINETAIKPYQAETITQEVALENAILPLKEFMLRQTRDEDIKLFMDLSGREPLQDETRILEDLPMHIVIPAFIISELRAGFLIGFLIYMPFIVIDMVVSSTLMSMGMMMLPPAMISLPFKILLFVLVDGWNLIIGQIIQTFR
jgi:flagellar biosynthetic protein FliP